MKYIFEYDIIKIEEEIEMEKEKIKNGVIILLVVIIAFLLAVIVLLATGTVSFKSKSIDNKNQSSENLNNDITNNKNDNSQQVVENQNVQDAKQTTLSNDEAMNIIKSVMKKSFDYMYALSPECGDRNKNDTFQENNHIYEASASYKTLDDLKTYLHTFLSDNIIKSVEEKYVVDMYKEKNNKLYCLNSVKDCGWVYNDDDTDYTLGPITDNEIKAGGNIYYETCDNEKKAKPVSFVLKKDSNNNWILDSYLSK